MAENSLSFKKLTQRFGKLTFEFNTQGARAGGEITWRGKYYKGKFKNNVIFRANVDNKDFLRDIAFWSKDKKAINDVLIKEILNKIDPGKWTEENKFLISPSGKFNVEFHQNNSICHITFLKI